MAEELQPQENIEQAAPQEPGVQQPTGQGKDEGQLAEKALTYIYGEAETFASLLKMLGEHKGESLPQGIATATVSILGKLEQDEGEIDTDKLQQVGGGIVTALYDLADKAGFVEVANNDDISKAYGLTVNLWMKQNPDRSDPELYAQETNKNMQGNAEAQPVSEPDPGLLGGMA